MKIDFTKDELNYLIENCNFNEENGELEVLKLRNKGYSIVSIAFKLNMTESTVKKRIEFIKMRIQRVISK